MLAVISASSNNLKKRKLASIYTLSPSGMISTALRSGTPLPQVTPCPLLDRFVINQHRGLNVTMENDDESDFGLPKKLTLETLENEQYL